MLDVRYNCGGSWGSRHSHIYWIILVNLYLYSHCKLIEWKTKNGLRSDNELNTRTAVSERHINRIDMKSNMRTIIKELR